MSFKRHALHGLGPTLRKIGDAPMTYSKALCHHVFKTDVILRAGMAQIAGELWVRLEILTGILDKQALEC